MPHFFTTPLRGLRFRPEAAREAVLSLSAGDLVDVACEPTNPHDANAIQIQVNGIHVGYVAREVACNVAPLMQAGLPARAEIVGFEGPLAPLIEITLPSEAEAEGND